MMVSRVSIKVIFILNDVYEDVKNEKDTNEASEIV